VKCGGVGVRVVDAGAARTQLGITDLTYLNRQTMSPLKHWNTSRVTPQARTKSDECCRAGPAYLGAGGSISGQKLPRVWFGRDGLPPERGNKGHRPDKGDGGLWNCYVALWHVSPGHVF